MADGARRKAAFAPEDVLLWFEVSHFLHEEAALLDAGDLRGWLDLLTDDVTYQMPVRVTRDRSGGPGFSDAVTHYKEDRYRLVKRVERLEGEYAWAEDPPSRVRHFVTNARVSGVDGDAVAVESNLLLFRTRGDDPEHELASAIRRDRLVRVDGHLRLAERVVLLDHTSLAMRNLSIFF